ncbi:hypothetical protein HETIRDRAFT_314110 [Heterobasidion irregulare TC 32-1]|uniref:Secreted protein n=1 Tax=Heterobasidion irregulare (strain TC 32-1) TaxID=747525 RepID=W4KH25_HETIT|nr:uncharacterized protein HETIRDRAFT_314110 [Heterobasidion irregulare TC 32-1]ETW84336.1 hypothetical protein HETIRDRAFT_314110 [Heterobasidion irregulare TC 32-1]
MCIFLPLRLRSLFIFTCIPRGDGRGGVLLWIDDAFKWFGLRVVSCRTSLPFFNSGSASLHMSYTYWFSMIHLSSVFELHSHFFLSRSSSRIPLRARSPVRLRASLFSCACRVPTSWPRRPLCFFPFRSLAASVLSYSLFIPSMRKAALRPIFNSCY